MHTSRGLARVHRPNIIGGLPISFLLPFKLCRRSLVLRISLWCFGFNRSGKSIRVSFDRIDVFVAGLEKLGLHLLPKVACHRP